LKKWFLLLTIPLIGVSIWGWQRRGEAPQVSFTKVRRETLVSVLSTNGKVEPYAWQAVRAERSGLVSSLAVREGQTVAAGAVLAVLSDPSLKSEIASAEARIAETRAAAAALDKGGRTAELAEIDSNLARARFDRQEAARELAILERLAGKQAATGAEVEAARVRVRQAELAAESLSKRRASLVSDSDRAIAAARIRDAEAALAILQQRAGLSAIRSPLAGVIYQLAVRQGAYLAVGEPVTNVGRLDRVRVRVYVDEPELGRVAEGQPVSITWDALPGKEWSGVVEKKPVAIETLGTRQVGEVICTIDNPSLELISGANVNAGIRTAVAANTLVIPKEVMRRDAAGAFVLGLRGETVARLGVQTGASSITRVEVTHGLAEGDAVALPTDVPLKAGDRVKPVYQ
jgi:HlyD family secretion protein